jgi:hypothetical protein
MPRWLGYLISDVVHLVQVDFPGNPGTALVFQWGLLNIPATVLVFGAVPVLWSLYRLLDIRGKELRLRSEIGG